MKRQLAYFITGVGVWLGEVGEFLEEQGLRLLPKREAEAERSWQG